MIRRGPRWVLVALGFAIVDVSLWVFLFPVPEARSLRAAIVAETPIVNSDVTQGFSTHKSRSPGGCRVLIYDDRGSQFDTIESTVKNYPLPWETLGCSSDGEVVFDVAFDDLSRELDWMFYFRNHLLGSMSVRLDGRVARFGEVIEEVTEDYDAVVRLGCLNRARVFSWLDESSKHFCVVRERCPTEVFDGYADRVCWIGQQDDNRCHFGFTELPLFDARKRPDPEITVCVKARHMGHSMLGQALKQVENLDDVKFRMYDQKIHRSYRHTSLLDQIQIDSEGRYLSHLESVSSCHVLLYLNSNDDSRFCSTSDLMSPETVISQAIAYKIPFIAHENIIHAFEETMVAPFRSYNDTDTLAGAFLDMVNLVSKEYDSLPEQVAVSSMPVEEDVPSEYRRPIVPGTGEPCVIVVENKVDFHYEILESVVLQYPLPWQELGCSTSDPVVFDVALTTTLGSDFDGEGESWISYFEESLGGRIRTRTDGVVVRFGSLVDYTDYTKEYHAVVDASCDFYQHQDWDDRHPNTFCVLHTSPTRYRFSRQQLGRSCYLNPMHPSCFFIPTNLPPVPHNASDVFRICISGKNRNYGLLLDALRQITLSSNAQIHLHGRHLDQDRTILVLQRKFPDLIKLVDGGEFLQFQSSLAQCDMLLPLIDPGHNPEYFTGPKMLSGVLPQAMAYRIPLVLHQDLFDIYGAYLTAPAWTYDHQDLAKALKAALSAVAVH